MGPNVPKPPYQCPKDILPRLEQDARMTPWLPLETLMAFDIRFVTHNEFKADEASSILALVGITVVALPITLEELQTDDTDRLVKDKTLKAFRQVGRPLFVEHTGLYLTHLNRLPGGLTQVFWDTLQANRFAELFGSTPDPTAEAKTIIGFTDAKNFFTFEGSISGRIAPQPRGSQAFQWDCVFVPDGHSQTFAELGDRKNDISMRRRALDALATFLVQRGYV
jgi:XTP/dITP diphosphohydrolase